MNDNNTYKHSNKPRRDVSGRLGGGGSLGLAGRLMNI